MKAKLTDTLIKAIKQTDKRQQFADGGGLVLYVMPNGSKLWQYRYRFFGKAKLLAIGKYPAVSLKDARAERDRAAELIAQGIDPSIDRQESKLKQEAAIENDFRSVAQLWWNGWKGDKTEAHATKVWGNLEKDIFPIIGKRPVNSIKPSLIRLTVQGVAKRGALDTAARVHQYIRSVLNYAVAHELIEANPALGLLLDDIIPKRKTKNQVRIDPKDLPQLLRDIDAYDGHVLTRYALQLMALTFVRTKELIEAEWSEIDFKARVWRIEPKRMKMKVAHIVPLSDQAMAVLAEVRKISGGNRYLFPSIKGDGKCMSNNTILYALYRMGYHGRMTGHGFRGVASTALNEQGYDENHIELQLAHLVGNEVKRAYDHSKHLIERTKMMQHWADYLDQQRGSGVVIPMKLA